MSSPDAATLESAIAKAAEQCPSVFAAYIFGSRARGEGRAHSDLDVAVLETPGRSLALEAEDRLRRYLDTKYLRRLQNVIRRLRKLQAIPLSQFREDEDSQWLAERGLHLGCQIVLDTGNHVLPGAFGRPAEIYEQILSGLGRQHVLSAALVEEVGGLGGFRNILVHAYLDLDPERVWEVLQRGRDRFERFARALTPARRTTSSSRCLR